MYINGCSLCSRARGAGNHREAALARIEDETKGIPLLFVTREHSPSNLGRSKGTLGVYSIGSLGMPLHFQLSPLPETENSIPGFRAQRGRLCLGRRCTSKTPAIGR
jgi:hypothetical protein